VVFDETLMVTRKSVLLHFEGDVALATQTIKSRITADTKEFVLLSLHSPVLIEGKVRSPSISIGRKIPMPDLGGATDAPCEELTASYLLLPNSDGSPGNCRALADDVRSAGREGRAALLAGGLLPGQRGCAEKLVRSDA
jgi:hypothetical protein